tara:strand:- start:653 stop:1282 length:630 start_codon:yes stop_codon:yes gene_type:complete
MKVTFKDLVEKELRGQLKENSQEAVLLSKIRSKSLSLSATITLRASEYLGEESLDAIDSATDDLVDTLIEEMLNGTEHNSTRSGKVKVDKIRGIRTKNGAFISALNLQRLLQLTLHDYVKSLMGTEDRLNYQTGRLAHSANILSITENEGRGSIYFSYMLYPYSTFEPGGKQYKPGRPPSELIDDALDKALADILHPDSLNKFVVKFGG